MTDVRVFEKTPGGMLYGDLRPHGGGRVSLGTRSPEAAIARAEELLAELAPGAPEPAGEESTPTAPETAVERPETALQVLAEQLKGADVEVERKALEAYLEERRTQALTAMNKTAWESVETGWRRRIAAWRASENEEIADERVIRLRVPNNMAYLLDA